MKEFRQIASYNWSNDDKPTIFVPGAARVYTESTSLRRLVKQYSKQMVDENRYRQPSCPLEAIFGAIYLCEPDFNFSNIDFVTDRNNLRKLLQFVEANADKLSFRIDMQKVDNFILFIRKDEDVEQVCNDYGIDFEKQYTVKQKTTDPDGSHRRIVNYKFGDHSMIVRFEVDCIGSKSAPNDNLVDDLASAISSISIQSRTEEGKKFNDLDLSYTEYGQFQTEDLVELTTKSSFEGFKFPNNKWNQMFFSNTSHLVVGWHKRGQLQALRKFDFDQVTKQCNRTKENTTESLNKLNDLLSKIKVFLSKSEIGSTYSIVCEIGDRLDIYKTESGPTAISESLMNKLKKKDKK